MFRNLLKENINNNLYLCICIYIYIYKYENCEFSYEKYMRTVEYFIPTLQGG